MSKYTVLLALNRNFYSKIISPIDLKRLHTIANVLPVEAPIAADKSFLIKHAGQADIVISTWDTAMFDEEVLAAAPNLKLVTHAAGSVRPIVSEAFWKRGIRVTSGASAIAYGVAEFCLGFLLMAPKHVFWLSEGTKHGQWREMETSFGGAFELYQQNVGIIGAGHIGKQLIALLQNFVCNIMVYDPFLSEENAQQLGAKKVETLDELFQKCRAISLNAPTNEGTRHMLRGSHFAALQPGSVFINTAGSIQIHEEEFIAELRKGRFIACIDRCEQEPCALDHPYRSLPNVVLTPHIAGAVAENLLRVGTFAIDEVEAFSQGKPLIHEVTEEALAKMA